MNYACTKMIDASVLGSNGSLSLEALNERLVVDVLLIAQVHIAENNGVLNEFLLANNKCVRYATGFSFTELGRE